MKISTIIRRHSAALTAIGLLTLHSASAYAARCEYVVQSDWNTGFVAAVRITNDTNTAINGWSVNWSYSDGSTRTSGWNANVSGNNPYTATGVGWNNQINPGQTIEFGVQGNKGVANSPAQRPTVTGAVCSNPVSSAPQSSSVRSDVSSSSRSSVIEFRSSSIQPSSSSAITLPSSRSSSSKSSVIEFVSSSLRPSSSSAIESSSSRSSSSRSSAISSVIEFTSSSVWSSSSSAETEAPNNPFTGARWYIDPIWSAKASSEVGGNLVANYNTAVWMDRIGAIAPTDGNFGLRDHLDAALAQGANLIQVVVYDLPNRDCHALASNGELTQDANGSMRYRTEYIDALAEIFSDSKYRSLRIIAIIEPDSLPNLVTNLSDPDCQLATDPVHGYVANTQYTLNKFATIPNVFSYVDIGHSGWLGWDDNFELATTLIANAIKGTTRGVQSISGFVSNTSGYTPLYEPFLDSLTKSPLPGSNGGTQVRQAKFYEWNPHFSEVAFVQAWRTKMIAAGFPATIGMLIDTSRNGWGGADRPTAQSTSTELETFVDGSRIDRRLHRGNWCNQPGGIGERPKADPAPGIDAYVWVKPPGESDGASSYELSYDPQDPAKGFDRMCDPTYTVTGTGLGTSALANAPVAGRWFPEAFRLLVQNAYPPLTSSTSSSVRSSSSSVTLPSSRSSSSASSIIEFRSSSSVINSSRSSSSFPSSAISSSSRSIAESSARSSSVPSSSSTTSSAAPVVSSSSSSSIPNHYNAPRATSTPVIDGSVDAVWERAAWASIDVFWLGTQSNPSAQDYSGRYKALWDEDYLYLLFDVTDDRIYDGVRDALDRYWEDDTVELFIDENKNGGQHGYNTSAWAYHISTYGDVVDYTTSGPKLLNDHVTSRLVSNGSKHLWEIRVRIYGEDYADWKTNTPLKLFAGKLMGFSACYIDNDGSPQRESMMGSVNTPGHKNNQGYLDAGVFGSLKLVE